MFTIAGIVGWIILDLGMFLMTTPPAFSPLLWYGFLIAGLVVGIVALIGELRDRKADAKRDAELKAGQKRHSHEHDILAAAALKNLETGPNLALLVEKLEGLTNTHGAPIVKTIAVANATIQTLQTEISDLRSMFWRRLTNEEKAALKERVATIGQYSFRIVSAHPVDCHELAGDLVKVFESAGWERKSVPATIEEHDLDDWNMAHTSGVRIVGQYPVDNPPGPKLADALKPLIKFGPSFGIGAHSGDADVVLFIGPKGARVLQSDK